MRVLGVDPGSSATGWALIVVEGNRYRLLESGVVRARGADRAAKLADLQQRLQQVVERTAPDCAAVESSFSGVNPRSSLALAEARGAILATLGRLHITCHAYTPAQVKSATVGYGTAEKQQIVFMVTRLLGLTEPPPRDAADAMAVGITHIHSKPPREVR